MARRQTNAAAWAKSHRRLQREKRLDLVTEPLANLAHTTAALLDQVTSDSPLNDSPVYSRVQAARAHIEVLTELHDRLLPPPPKDDPLDRIAKELSETGF